MGNLEGANLQKIRNGKKTFAITPGLPAGFISPKQLRIFADTAEKYGLTMKLTSAQRMMLIGLKEEQVEAVWQDLGMKPAFTSSSSVRSVKICPGTTFCKRGHQDSVKIGMILDKRYLGMELPKKMKIGVSGCPNSCGESMLKDIGLVGQNEGWSLYVGGSAGGRPRIGDLLVEGLNDEELLRIVDIVVNYFKKNSQLERLGDLIDRVSFPVFQASIMTEFKGEAFVPVKSVEEGKSLGSVEIPIKALVAELPKVKIPLTGESIVGDIIREYPHTLEIFRSFGMGCSGCNAAGNEPLDKACRIHGLEIKLILEALNKSFNLAG